MEVGPERRDGFDNDCNGAIDDGDGLEPGYEGCGADTPGGEGGEVAWVDTLAAEGPGSLREAVETRDGAVPRMVRFSVGGTIDLDRTLTIQAPYVTVDGASAPEPGITLATSDPEVLLVRIGGTHDVVLSHLRLVGPWEPGADDTAGAGAVGIFGTDPPDLVAHHVVLDHLTVHGANDVGVDVWGEVQDATVSWSLVYGNRHPMTVSHHPAPFAVRDCISVHHVVLSGNDERSPQVRADSRRIDLVNNVVHDWGGLDDGDSHGIRIRADEGEPAPEVNVVANLLLATREDASALVYGDVAGPGDDGGPANPVPQGTVVTGTRMGPLYVSGNVLPDACTDRYGTVDAPAEVPAVTTREAGTLVAEVVPYAGMRPLLPAEADVLKAIGQ
jgi:hypothetical protein